MQEIQSANGNAIVRDKAAQAYNHFQQPILVNDDTWSISALRGFPGTGMKLCNDFLVAEDWLRLMRGIEDRRIFLISYYAYHDGKSVKTAVVKRERHFLNEIRGTHPTSPCLQVIATPGSQISIAEEIATGREVERDNTDFWRDLAEIIGNE